MIGRAGRKGVDTEGESILLCRESDRKRVEQLVMSDLKPVKSCLIQDNGETLCSSMKRAILEVIVSGVARSVFFKLFTHFLTCSFRFLHSNHSFQLAF